MAGRRERSKPITERDAREAVLRAQGLVERWPGKLLMFLEAHSTGQRDTAMSLAGEIGEDAVLILKLLDAALEGRYGTLLDGPRPHAMRTKWRD